MEPVTLLLGKAWSLLGVRGVIAAGMGALLLIVMWRADSLSNSLEEAEVALTTETIKHDVTRASLASLTQRLQDLVEEGQLRQERLDTALEAVSEDTASLRDMADRLESGEIDVTEVEGL